MQSLSTEPLNSARELRLIGPAVPVVVVNGRGWWMTFGDLLNNAQLILIVCDECNARTPIDPAPHALHAGLGADISQLAAEVRCPVCGSADIKLKAHSPVENRAASHALAK